MSDQEVTAVATEEAAVVATGEAAVQPTDDLAAQLEDAKQKEKRANDRLSQIIRNAKAQGFDTEAIKGRVQEDNSPRTSSQQSDYERRLAAGELDQEDIIADKLLKRLGPEIVQANKAALSEMKEAESVKEEGVQAMTNLAAIADEYGLTEGEAAAAWQEADSIGINVNKRGGPSRHAVVTAKIMRSMFLQKTLEGRTTKAETTAEEKARTALLASQPGKGAAPEKKAPTPEQKALADMQAVAPRSAANLLDSRRNK
jgi:uncharacterized protein (UPF0335 family)